MHVALQANIIVAQENDIFIERDHFSLSLLSAAIGALNGTSRGARALTQALDAFLVRTEVPRRAHCCEQSTRDADWPNGARETRPPARPCIIHTHAFIAESRVRAHTREKEGQKWVGCANHFLLVRSVFGIIGYSCVPHRAEDVHRCEKEKSSLYARMTLFSHTNCVETRSRTRTAAPNFAAVFAPLFNFTQAISFDRP